MTTRRDLLALAALAALAPARAAGGEAGPTVLFLGGTGFLGPHMVRYAQGRGHAVTLFNRGKTNPGLFPGVETLIGDRDGALEALAGRRFDVVIDTSGYVPRHVADSARLLSSSGVYLFVSTVSVYADTSPPGITEDAAVGTLDDPEVEEVTGETYGPLKARCEHEVREVFGSRAIVVRPTLIVGPGDPTDRFTYWPVRIRRGGEVLAPGAPTDPVQFVDARDLGEFCVRLAEQRAGGTFNVVGPRGGTTVAQMLYGIEGSVASEVRFTWVDASFLEQEQVAPWSDLPVWVPPEGAYAGFGRVDASRARAAGMTWRPLADTARDTLAWVGERDLRGGLSAEREAEVLGRWHRR